MVTIQYGGLTFTIATFCVCQLGCAQSTFMPAPPQGQTYQYDYQGFRSSDTTVVAGASKYGPSYAGVFAFRDRKDVHAEAGGKEPFAQSAPIDGYQFNTHLPGQGVRLAPAAGLPVSVISPVTPVEPPR
jgi:hypothetical protein